MTTNSFTLNNKKVINGWAFFDWANSAFALVITTAIFPAYFIGVTDDEIHIFGSTISNSALYAYAISFSYLLIASLSPLLSGIADFGGKKKFFLKLFTMMGSVACLSLFFFQGMSQLFLGTAGFILAMTGFAGALVFYNSYLPEIVSEDRYDRVSAKGFAYGYVGSLILLFACLVMIQKPGWFGLPTEGTLPVRLSFVLVGLWWIGFALIPFRRLPADQDKEKVGGIIGKGVQELKKVWKSTRNQIDLKRFLYAFFCYSAGVQTVLFLASTFAEKELAFGTAELISVILVLQLLAIAGAFLFAKISELQGNKRSLIYMLVIWTLICLTAYFVNGKVFFYFIAGAVGLVMGGIQSLSRSTYSKLLPEETEDTTSYFSFYDVLEKVAIVLGTLLFGLLDQLTGSMRISILVLGVFFLLGIFILSRVKIHHEKA